MTTSRTIAYIANRAGLDSQALLSAAAAQWRAAGKPLLTTVSPRHMESWNASAPAALRLDGDAAAIAQWWNTVRPGPP